jgi:hypothetical protein
VTNTPISVTEDRKRLVNVQRDRLHSRLRRIARTAATDGMARDDIADCFEAVVDEYRDNSNR